jgi:AcrR family transcriptional regulator
MPYPAQVDAERIVLKAREMIEAEGVAALSLAKLAAALGIKAPSLYRYFPSKTDLLRAVNTVLNEQLVAALNESASQAGDDPTTRMVAIAKAYREFAHRFPATYDLAFTSTIPEIQPDTEALERLALPIQAIMAQVSGEADSLAALRGAMALIHGFVSLEQNGQFRRGGDLDAAFTRAFEAYLAGWQKKT